MLTKVYNSDLQCVAYLENAYNIGYEKRLNELWTAQFSLPSTDPKNDECLPFRFVEIFDANDRVDFFRIIPSKTVKNDSDKSVTYQCEHVFATLLDDIMFQYHEQVGLSTSAVLSYILGFQSVERWQLGQVDFSQTLQYKWENENLLAALFSVPRPFDADYMWTCDTTTFPWTINLVQLSDIVNSEIRYRKNMRGIEREDDPSNLCTRLYALGYGEGVNQLGISNVNPTGQPYIDADTQGQYGIISRVFVDRRYENETSLYNVAVAALEKLKSPRVTYKVSGADVYQITNDTIDKFELGTLTRAIDDDFGTFEARIVGLKKSDVNGNPGDIEIVIDNHAQSIASSITSLSDRTRINEVYAQGATNLDSHDFADNCDPGHPAVIRFYLPEETVRINKMILSYETSEFRAYSKDTLGGGGTTVTSESGGSSTQTSSSGGASTETSSSGGGETIPFSTKGSVNFGSILGTEKSFITTIGGDGSDVGHYHKIYDFSLFTQDHTHTVIIPAHTHNVNIPAHTHNVQLPEHIHGIDYGIFLRTPAPEAVTITVDGNEVPITSASGDNIDIIPYLAVDGEGKVTRGSWHEIKITPDDLGRVVANVVTQLFVQSRGGGDH